MKFLKILFTALISYIPSAWSALDYNIKYSSNYLMPAYVHFKADGTQYSVNAKINIPLYNIVFLSRGSQTPSQFKMVNYQDVRNGKPYALSKISPTTIEYGKVKNGLKTEALNLPTFDLFTMAFQLSYYDKLPTSFQITNGKKLYPMENVKVNKREKQIEYNKQNVTEITYTFKTGNKDIMVKKFAGEQFPRYIKYSRDGDDYELEFSEFVK
ncbi:hypothetical protein BKK49_07715 [Rodentibacter rarus]|uniref:Outer membrane protein n=1 Tax=Rodentibacter rarus TaxID=1908260 RepID=A0A1V3IRL5_9PAST|nr:hypothetical protein [Rodentibacter rarus]OOF39598.1 hypothetical protein BKK49_07715 [Rodentibacter rarus]OOF44690.1 hypothetical protein BKK50_01825 [Rodentibacter rarus]